MAGLLGACSQHQEPKPPELRLLDSRREPVATLSADDDLFDSQHRLAGHYDRASATVFIHGLVLKHDEFIRNISPTSFDLTYPGQYPRHLVVDGNNGLIENGVMTGFIVGSRWATDEGRWSALLISAPLMGRDDDHARPRDAGPDAHVPGPPPPPPP